MRPSLFVFQQAGPEPHLLSIRNIVGTAAAVMTLLSGVLAYSNWKTSSQLAETRGALQVAVNEAKQADAKAAKAVVAAQVSNATAAKLTAEAKQHAVKGSYKQAYESQLKATASLQAAVDTLTPALINARASLAKLGAGSQKLIDQSRGSFWKRLVPTVHVGVMAGVNPQGKPDAVVGVGVGWNI